MVRTAKEHWFSEFASEAATKSGRPWAFGIAGGFVAGWLVTGDEHYQQHRDIPDGILNSECAKPRQHRVTT